MISKKPKGIKIDPSRLQMNNAKSEPEILFPKQPEDKEKE